MKHTRGMPISLYFFECEDGTLEVGFNGAGYPKIKEAEKALLALSNLLKEMRDIGQDGLDKYNQELEEKQYTKMVEENNRVNKKEREKVKGYIYLIKSNDYYKIGRALNFKDRLKTYRTENPHETEVVFQKQVDDYVGIESMLLKKFKDKQHRGEWFTLSIEDINYIKSI